MDEYYLSQSPERLLMAQHYHSSMDTQNLDNVEAKLYATRQKNHQMAMKYFKNKFGSTKIYEEFADTHNLGPMIDADQTADLKRHLERKARQIQDSQSRKRKAYKATQQENQVKQYSNSKKKHKNPWHTDSQKRQQKPQQNIRQEEAVENARVAKGESEFINEFKKYLSHKKQTNFLPQSSKSPEKVGKQTTQSNLLEKSQKSQGKKAKSYEEELVKKIFIDLTGSSNSHQKVEKLTLLQYLVMNKKILKVIGISEEELNSKLLVEHETKEQSNIGFHQVLFFILKAVGKESSINSIKQDIRDRSVPPGCMLSQGTIHYFEEVFNRIDRHCDLIVKRVQYINTLACDPLIKKQLNLAAVHQTEFDRHVSLRRIFERIEMQALVGSQQDKKAKEYISWNQFLTYFRSGSHGRTNYDLMVLVDSLCKENKFGLDIPELVSAIIGKALKKVDKGSEYFNAFELLQEISKSSQYEHEKFTLVRSGAEGSLDSQTFEDVLNRIKQKAKEYMTVKEFLQYFSTRGKPIEEFQQTSHVKDKKSYEGVKVKFAEEEHLDTKKYEPDGYDSDPQMYSSNLMQSKGGRKNRKQKGETSKSFYVEDSQVNAGRSHFKVTIPEPFKFEEREKQKQKRISRALSKTEVEMSQFKAKGIPEKVKDPNLYQRMLNEDQKRIQERKKHSMIMTLANERPFSFENRKTNKKTNKQREEFIFKAKPIPWFCSVDLLVKKHETQISRNEKIAKSAQESLAKAKLPPRMERDYQEKLAKKALEQKGHRKPQTQLKVYKKPPNFGKIHKEFEEEMERKRKQNKVTKPEEFQFSQTHKRSKIVNKEEQNNFSKDIIKQTLHGSFEKILQPKKVAASTLKFTQQAEKRREQMEEKRKQEQKIKKEEEERQRIDEQLKKKVQSLAKNKENKEKELLEKRKEELDQQRKNFKSWKKDCLQKGREQPLLVERPLKRDEKIEKMRKLYQISETLKSNGIRGKDHDQYFKRDELILLQDYEAIKHKL